MRLTLLALIFIPFISYGQFRIVGNANFTTVNDTTYTGIVTAKPDATGFGYTTFNIQVGDILFTAIEYGYKIDSVWNKTRTTANIRIVEYNIIGDSLVNQPYNKPYGQFAIARLNPNRTIPQVPVAILAASSQLNTAIDAHNAKITVTTVMEKVDSTRLSPTGDSLYYYLNDSLLYVEKILSGGNETFTLVDSILTITDNQGVVDVDIKSAYDNTDDQQLTLSNDTLYLENGGFVIIPATGSDTSATNELQVLSFSNDTLYLTQGGSVYLGNYNVDTSGYNRNFYISNDTLYLQDDLSVKSVVLTSYVNTDDQQITISNDTIFLEDGGSVKLPITGVDSTRLNTGRDSLIYYFDGVVLGKQAIITYTDNLTILGNGTSANPLYVDSLLFVTTNALNDSLTNFTTIIDSTRLSSSGDSLLYYQNGVLIGFDTLSKGNGIFQEKYIGDGISNNLLITAYNGLLPDDKQDILVYRNGIFIDQEYIVSLDQVNGVVQLSFTPQAGDRMMIVWFTGTVDVQVGGGIDSVFTDSTMYGNGTLLYPLGVNQDFMATKDYVDAQFIAAGSGDITGVNEGINPELEYGLLGGGDVGSVEIRVDSSIIAAKSWVIAQNYGDIDSVNAGYGLLGGGDVDNVTLSVDTTTMATINYVNSQGFLTANDSITLSGDVVTVKNTTDFTLEVTEADNIEGGGAGDLLYQSTANTTAFLDLPAIQLTNTKVLVNGSAAPFWQDKTDVTVGSALKLDTARTINGVAFDGTQNITIPINTFEFLIAGDYLSGNNFDGSVETIWDVDTASLRPWVESLSSTLSNLIISSAGNGATSPVYYNGSQSYTISYNTIGAPSVTGDNAGGTWNIDISGNSATTTKLDTARTFQIAGDAVAANGAAVQFDGTAGVQLEIDGINASFLTTGTVPQNRLSGFYNIRSAITDAVEWDSVLNKPLTFNPSAHTHPHTDITSKDPYYVDTANNQFIFGQKIFNDELTVLSKISTSYLLNVVVGDAAGNSLNGTSKFNTLLGTAAGYNLRDADTSNVVIGYYAGVNLRGGENLIIGENSLSSFGINTHKSVALGAESKLTNNSVNEIAIGFDAQGIGSNTATIGNSIEKFKVNNYVFNTDQVPVNGYVLTYNSGNGLIELQSPSSGTVITTESVTFNNTGSGANSGSSFNGSTPLTVSYNTIGAPSTTGVNATGEWDIDITGSANFAATSTTSQFTNFPKVNNTQTSSDINYDLLFTDFTGVSDYYNVNSINGKITYNPNTGYFRMNNYLFLAGQSLAGTEGYYLKYDGNKIFLDSITHPDTVTNADKLLMGFGGDQNYSLVFTSAQGVGYQSFITTAGDFTYNPSQRKLKFGNYVFDGSQDTIGLDGQVLTYVADSNKILLQPSAASTHQVVLNLNISGQKLIGYSAIPYNVRGCSVESITIGGNLTDCTNCDWTVNVGSESGGVFTTSYTIPISITDFTGNKPFYGSATFSQTITSSHELFQLIPPIAGISALTNVSASFYIECN
jgi:hypothetical protein